MINLFTAPRNHQFVAIAMLLSISTYTLAADPEKGEELYVSHGCYSCHGYNGAGARPLTEGASTMTRDKDLFLSYLRLRADENPMLPALSIPSFSIEALSDDEATDIFAYINTLVDDAPAFEDIPVFQEIMDSAEE